MISARKTGVTLRIMHEGVTVWQLHIANQNPGKSLDLPLRLFRSP
jgi:hypothetical protein